MDVDWLNALPFPAYALHPLATIGGVNLQTTAPDYARFLVNVMCGDGRRASQP